MTQSGHYSWHCAKHPVYTPFRIQYRWELERVNGELEKIMRRSYTAVREVAKEKQLDLRTAAFVLAIQRVGQAALSRRHLSERIEL